MLDEVVLCGFEGGVPVPRVSFDGSEYIWRMSHYQWLLACPMPCVASMTVFSLPFGDLGVQNEAEICLVTVSFFVPAATLPRLAVALVVATARKSTKAESSSHLGKLKTTFSDSNVTGT